MGLLEFNKLPINTLVGADWKTFGDITRGRTIDPAYRGKYRLTKAVCRLLSPLASIQDRRYAKLLADRPLEHDPVFILGHWRSGTIPIVSPWCNSLGLIGCGRQNTAGAMRGQRCRSSIRK